MAQNINVFFKLSSKVITATLKSVSNDPQQTDDVYGDRELAPVPFWYHSAVCLVLSVLGIIGVSLNGFVIWSFALLRNVSSTYQKAIPRAFRVF